MSSCCVSEKEFEATQSESFRINSAERVLLYDKRRITDVTFLLLLSGFWIVMTAIGIYSIKNGNPYLLISPVNDQGQVCGHSNAVRSQPYFYSVLTSGIGVCVSSCPTNSSVPFTSTNPDDYYCLNSIIYQGLQTSDYITAACFTAGQFDATKNCGCMIEAATTDSLGRCRFSDSAIANQFSTQAIAGLLTTVVSDLITASTVVLGYGIGLAFVLSAIYFSLLRYRVVDTIFVWSSVLGLMGLCGWLIYFAYTAYALEEMLAVKIVTVILAVLVLVLFVVMFVNRHHVMMAIEIISISSECMDSIPALFLVPLFKTIALVAFIVSALLF